MKAIALAASAFLTAAPAQAPDVPQPPQEYQSLKPMTVRATFADAQWVDAECARIIGRPAGPGYVYEACAGVGQPWMVLRHGALYPAECGMGPVVSHETGHVRGWYHG